MLCSCLCAPPGVLFFHFTCLGVVCKDYVSEARFVLVANNLWIWYHVLIQGIKRPDGPHGVYVWNRIKEREANLLPSVTKKDGNC